jgi:hypothetical protein
MSLIKNPLLGMLNFVNFWFTSFLFAGFFAREIDVIWPFKLFVYILPMRWSLAVIIRTEVHTPDLSTLNPTSQTLGDVPSHTCRSTQHGLDTEKFNSL